MAIERRVTVPRLGLSLALAASMLSLAAAQTAPQKRRVAVLNFEYGTVQSGLAAIFGSNIDVGRGIADILVEKLVQGGAYTVYERKALDKILAEQNFSNSDRADSSSAAKIGRLLGVEAIIVGSITQFGRDDKQTNIGGLGGVAGRYGLGGVGRKESKALVAVSTRIINVDTGEIMAVATGKGESNRSGASLLGAGGGGGAYGGGGFDMTNRNFADTILGEATNKAVTSVASQLNAAAAQIPARVIKIEGLVADFSGDTVILNIGSRAGVKTGDRLTIRRTAREIKDPATGQVIRRIEETVGDVTITEVDELSAVGRFSGPGKPKAGDNVRPAQ
ncbi:MAG: curli production assembly protein CsgG [Acidobacteria bacterium]|nr:curli production assembly protein CsgG [Acidobacteriota bacterium]